MRRILTLWLCLGSALLSFQTSLARGPVAPPADAHPLRFVPNQRQWEKPVLFAADVPAGRLYLERGRLLVARYDARAVDELHHHRGAAAQAKVKAHAYAVSFVGANPQVKVSGEQPTGEHSSYFLGSDPSRWASNVPAFTDVRYRQLYPGTDLRFYSRGAVMEYDFELAPGADPARIQLRYAGQQALRVVDGALQVETSVGRVTEQKPFAYQLLNGVKVPVPCHYVLGPKNTVSFGLPRGYNHALPLVIDPVLVYATYAGASAQNWGFTATYDTLGNLYTGGIVFTAGYPVTTGAYDLSYNGAKDIVITKYDPSAPTGSSSLRYATYLGGNADDFPHSLVVNRANELVLLGSTESNNFPTPTNALDRSYNGGTDLVVAKLSATGSQLLASTYVGGSGLDGQLLTSSNLYVNFGDDYRGDIVTDRQNNVYFASVTRSTNYPTTGGRTHSGGHDAVVTQLNSGLTSRGWSQYLGGAGDDAGYSIRLDSLGGVYVGGGTTSTNLPNTAGTYRSSYQGGPSDGFVALLRASIITPGVSLGPVTYLGTSSYDQAYFVQLDRQGAVYVLGQTNGAYPVSAGVYRNPGSRQFIHKLNAGLTSSVFSTVFGNGAGTPTSANPYPTNLSPTAFLVDNCGQILLSGWGASSIAGMPTTPDALLRAAANTAPSSPADANLNTFGHMYVLQLSPNARRLVYGTYYGTGSTHVDGGTSRFDKKGVIYQAICIRGNTSPTIPLTPNAYARSFSGGGNSAAFKMDVARLDAGFVPAAAGVPGNRTGCAPLTVSFNRPTPSNNGTTWDFGNGQTSTQANNVSTTYALPGTYTVRLTAYDSTSCAPSVSATETITVLGLPRAALGPDQTICPGASATLNVAGASPVQIATYVWTPATGLNTTSGPTVVASPAATTQYVMTATVLGGCVTRDTVVVRVNSQLAVGVSPAATICPAATATLSAADAGPGAAYTWSPAAGLSSTSGRTVTASPAGTTKYYVRVSSAAGCVGRDSVTVTVLVPPALSISPSRAAVLPNEELTFTPTSTGALSGHRWDFGNGQTSLQASPVHAYTTPGTYLVRLTATYASGCPVDAQLSVTVATPRDFKFPNVITPNNDNLNDTFRPYVSAEPVSLQVFSRWGRKVYEQESYTDGWGSDPGLAAGLYYYRLSSASGQSWNGWVEVVK